MALNPRIDHWPGRRAWIVGASSGIGRATAAALQARGAQVVVSARNAAALQSFVARHPGSEAVVLDCTDRAAVQSAATALLAGGPLGVVCYCAGTSPPMRASEVDLDVMLAHQRVNVMGALHLLGAVVPAMVQRAEAGGSAGHISLVASVAGFRALPQSLAYGPTKAALIHLAEGLYLDLHDLGIGVSLVNPGFVATPLTAGNAFRMPALISSEEAALAMVRGWERGAFEIHFPKRFTRVMRLLRLLPPALYFPAVRRVTGL